MLIKTFGYLIFTSLFFFGLFLVYRGAIPSTKIQKIESGIIGKSFYTTYTLKGKPRYSLAIQLSSLDYKIGIPLSNNKEEAIHDTMISKVEIGKTYCFYINPTYPLADGINNGIIKVEFNGATIYNRNETASIYFGLILSLFSLLIMIFLARSKRKIKST